MSMKVLATFNITGGVGKTAAAVNLAYLAAEGARSTLLWDLDPQGAASFYFRIKNKIRGGSAAIVRKKQPLDELVKGTDFPYLDLLPADFSLRRLDSALDQKKDPVRRLARRMRGLEESYDFVVLDCPPGLSLASEAVIEACDALLVPVIPTTLSVRTLEQLLRFLKSHHLRHKPLLPFFSMVDMRKRLHRDVMDTLWLAQCGMLHSWIPGASEVERMGVERLPLVHFAPKSRAAGAFRDLWQEVDERLWRNARDAPPG